VKHSGFSSLPWLRLLVLLALVLTSWSTTWSAAVRGQEVGADAPDEMPSDASDDIPGDAPASASLKVEPVQLPARVIGELNLWSAPGADEGTLIRALSHNEELWVHDVLTDANGERWYRVGEEAYVYAPAIRLPLAPPQTFPGRWLDVELTTPAMVTAYEDNEAVFSALAIKGRIADATPVGTYRILLRVYDETMDSETLGIPFADPRGYYLENVLYTQYFTDAGDSLHFNYWSSSFGEEGSNGCLGLSLEDAAWLWDWADLGTVINIHA
jgi:hypothetical protein